MLFNSLEFALFLPVVFLLYWKVCHNLTSRNILIVAASYLFYGWWDIRFLGLIFFTSVCSYFSGLIIGGSYSRKWGTVALWINVVVNLGILGLFKYFNFFSQSFSALLNAVGFSVDTVTLHLILPVGISFYTFQALSYSIDVYRRVISPTRNFIAFMAFISFFPQLVAGPIERATNLLPQFLRPSSFDYSAAVEGMKLILWGLFKKMVVADNAALIVDRIFGDIHSMSAPNLWIGAILFSFQIYCDFSGYSDIAVGVARLFGITLMRNFKLPYFASDIHDFWKRWHISLTSWFRDYLYIPLGGNRKGRFRTAINTTIVFLLSGLWHGANLTFILWGGYHGALSVPRILSRDKKIKRGATLVGNVLAMGSTFILVVIGWIIFRAATVSDLSAYLSGLFTAPWHGGFMGKSALCWCGLLILIEGFTHRFATPFSLPLRGLWCYTYVRWSVYLLSVVIIMFFTGRSSQFIYFQF